MTRGALAGLAGSVLCGLAPDAAAQPGSEAGPGAAARRLETLAGIASVVRACWTPPPGLRRLERMAVTARFGLRADGKLLGEPRITFSTLPADTRARELLARSAREALRSCTPLPLSAGLGQTIAGRPITVRFTYEGPRGQGA